MVGQKGFRFTLEIEMSLFVLGRSRTGKTPFAAQVALALGCPHLMASEWVRKRFPPARFPDRQSLVDALTRFAVEELKRDPRACIDYIRTHHDLGRFNVIEGVRNPHDFVHLFDPRRDAVVFLEHTANELRPTAFEGGLGVIETYLDYLRDAGLLSRPDVFVYRYPELYEPAGQEIRPAQESPDEPGVLLSTSLDAAIQDFLTRWRALQSSAETSVPAADPARPQRIHADIPPLKTHLRGEYLYDMDLSHAGEFVPCTAFAVSSYRGSTPTFKVLLTDGAVFSYVPPSALIDPEKAQGKETLQLTDLVYHNCPSGDICIHSFEQLRGPVHAYLKSRDAWMDGEYLWTLDWYTGNDLLHLVALENGQYAFLPHHKLKFKDGPRELPGYRKLHAEWKV
jgi:hypothetical protein